MSYTRRQILRNAALASVAGVAASPLTLLSGCHHDHKHIPQYGPNNPTMFNLGVRIFLIGSWLFCADPQSSSSVLAVTADMPTPMHHFP